MILTLPRLATALQEVFTEVAERAARDSGLVRRRRRVSGADLVRALVFGWLEDPDATVDDLAAPLGITASGLDARFGPAAVDCLHRVLRAAPGRVFRAEAEAIPLLARFPRVAIEDATAVPLPAELAGAYPGCGGPRPGVGGAGLKLLVRLEPGTGGLAELVVAAGRASERALAAGLAELPPGGLRLADLGFFDVARLAADTARGVRWISRLPAKIHVDGRELADWLARRRADRIDDQVTVGAAAGLRCRLVARRLPAEQAATRLRRLRRRLARKGRTLSSRQRRLCGWSVLVTDLDAADLTAEQLHVLYRARWQVELLFKRWKGAGLGRSRGRRGGRVLCEALAKLIGLVIRQWATLLRGGPLGAASPQRAFARVRHWASRLAEALASGPPGRLGEVLGRLQRDLQRLAPRPRRTHHPTTRQLLLDPSLAP